MLKDLGLEELESHVYSEKALFVRPCTARKRGSNGPSMNLTEILHEKPLMNIPPLKM